MKIINKLFTIIFISLSLSGYNTYSQILCINCYKQNVPVSTNVTNMVVNGSFEYTTPSGGTPYFCPASNFYAADIDNWTCMGGGPSTYSHLVDASWSTIPDGIKGCYLGNWFCKVCSPVEDDTSCIETEGCIVTGIPAGYPDNNLGASYGGTSGVSISQTVSGLTPGSVYVLEFWCGGEYLSAFHDPGVFGLDIGFGRYYLSCPPTDVQDTGVRYIVQFMAITNSETITFINWGHKCNSCTEVILDDVRLYPISQLSSIIPACTVGEEDIASNNVGVLNNPSLRQLEIRSKQNLKYQITIYNSVSQIVIERNFNNAADINLGELTNGLYIYEIRTSSGIVKKSKFVLM